MLKKLLFAGVGIAFIATPFISSAQTVTASAGLTISGLQAEIASLLSQIQMLQGEGSAASSSVSAGNGGSLSGTVVSSCPNFTRSLSIGSTGSDVTALQEFLSAQGDLNVSATGYFGALTKAAVAKWQVQNGVVASGNAGLGVFGPLSRAYLDTNCTGSQSGQSGGSTTTAAGVNFSASPSSGSAPLTVEFTATAPQGAELGNTVDFGDGSTGTLDVVPTCSSCNEEGVVSHTYASAGTYNATLTNNMCSCPANGICNCPNIPILGTATVTVNASGTGTTSSNIQQLNAPGGVTLPVNGIAEIRNESFYFALNSLTSSTATIQITPVGCWNSFPSDTPPAIRCMIAMVPIPPQTLSIGQSYAAANYGIELTGISNSEATFSITASSAPATVVE